MLTTKKKKGVGMLELATKKIGVILLVLSLSVFVGTSFTEAQPEDRPEYLPDEILAKFKDGVAKNTINSIIRKVNGNVIRKYRLVSLMHLKVPANTVKLAVNHLRGLPEVEYAEPNYLRYLNDTPNDPRYPEMWGLENTGQTGGTPDADIGAPEAWDIITGDSDVAVAVIDSGADLDHEDLIGNIWTNPGEIPGNGIDDDSNGFVDDIVDGTLPERTTIQMITSLPVAVMEPILPGL